MAQGLDIVVVGIVHVAMHHRRHLRAAGMNVRTAGPLDREFVFVLGPARIRRAVVELADGFQQVAARLGMRDIVAVQHQVLVRHVAYVAICHQDAQGRFAVFLRGRVGQTRLPPPIERGEFPLGLDGHFVDRGQFGGHLRDGFWDNKFAIDPILVLKNSLLGELLIDPMQLAVAIVGDVDERAVLGVLLILAVQFALLIARFELLLATGEVADVRAVQLPIDVIRQDVPLAVGVKLFVRAVLLAVGIDRVDRLLLAVGKFFDDIIGRVSQGNEPEQRR